MGPRTGAVLFILLLSALSRGEGVHVPEPPQRDVFKADSLSNARQGGLLEVDTSVRQNVVAFWFSEYMASEGINAGWTGVVSQCEAGDISEASREASRRRLNYYRAMAGVPADVRFSEEENRKCQEAALMMIAEGRNDHDPQPGFACYSPDGADAAKRANLALGRSGPATIDLWMEDPGENNRPVGHRRWMLYPLMGEMGFGSTTAFNSGFWGSGVLVVSPQLLAPRPANPEYVAWPPPGYVPYQTVFPRWSFAYSVQINQAGEINLDNAKITMKREGTPIPVREIVSDNRFGGPALIWEPDDSIAEGGKPQEDVEYTVAIENVIVRGTPRNFEYSVTIIDPNRIVPEEYVSIVEWLLGESYDAPEPDQNLDSLVDAADVKTAISKP